MKMEVSDVSCGHGGQRDRRIHSSTPSDASLRKRRQSTPPEDTATVPPKKAKTVPSNVRLRSLIVSISSHKLKGTILEINWEDVNEIEAKDSLEDFYRRFESLRHTRIYTVKDNGEYDHRILSTADLRVAVAGCQSNSTMSRGRILPFVAVGMDKELDREDEKVWNNILEIIPRPCRLLASLPRERAFRLDIDNKQGWWSQPNAEVSARLLASCLDDGSRGVAPAVSKAGVDQHATGMAHWSGQAVERQLQPYNAEASQAENARQEQQAGQQIPADEQTRDKNERKVLNEQRLLREKTASVSIAGQSDLGQRYSQLQDDKTRYPRMIRAKDAIKALSPSNIQTLKTPSIDLSDLDVSVRFDELLSTIKGETLLINEPDADMRGDDDSDVEELDPDDFKVNIKEAIGADQLSAKFAQKVYDFLGFDPAEKSPDAKIWLPGWNSEYALYIWQAYAACWALRQIAKCEDLVYLALGVGLGKTPIGLAILLSLSKQQLKYPGPGHEVRGTPLLKRDEQWQDPHDSAMLNLTTLIGQKPKVRKGLAVVTMPSNLLQQWLTDFEKFILPEEADRLFVCVATTDKRLKMPRNCFRYTDVLSIGHEAVPTIEELKKSYLPWRLEEFGKHGIPVHELMTVDVKGNAEPWQHRWVIMVPHTFIGKLLFTHRHPQYSLDTYAPLDEKDDEDPEAAEFPPRTNREKEAMDVKISVMIIDESHQYKSKETLLWQSVAALGDFAMVCLSATPYEVPDDMEAPMMAAQARYFDVQVKKTSVFLKKQGSQQQMVYEQFVNLDPGDIKKILDPDLNNNKQNLGKMVKFKSHLGEDDQEFIKERSWWRVYKAARKLGSSVPKTTDNAEERFLDTSNKDTATHRKTVAEYFAKMMLQWTPDFLWGFGPKNTRVPAAPKPPHCAFHVEFDNTATASATYANWAKREVCELKSVGNRYIALWGSLDVYSVWPELITLQEKGKNLSQELGNLSRDKCNSLDEESVLFKQYMVEFHKTPLATNLLALAKKLRSMKNIYGHTRKIVVSAVKPLIMKIISLYFVWLACKAKDHPSEYPELWNREDLCLQETWASSGKKKAQMKRVDDFADYKQYKPSPSILLANQGSIKSGVNLATADAMIVVDVDWTTETMVQLSGRISRNKDVQKNKRTELYWLTGNMVDTAVNWQKMKQDRSLAKSEIQKKLLDVVGDLEG